MSAYVHFLAHPATTRRLLAMRLEFAAIDADERRRTIEAIPQPHEGVKATLRGAQVGSGNREGAERIEDGVVQVGHDDQPTARQYLNPRTLWGEASREGARR